MTDWMRFRVLCVCLSLVGYGASANASPTEIKIEKQILKKIDQRELTIPVLVYLATSADLQGAQFLQTRAQKGTFVVQNLKEVALRSQAPVIRLLQQFRFSFRPFYIVNMIAISNATPALIQGLAQRPEIERIEYDKKIVLQEPAERSFEEEPPPRQPMTIEPNISATSAPWFWENRKTQGKGIVVGGQDTGVDWDHPALVRQYRGSLREGGVNHTYNWHDSVHSPIKKREEYDRPNPCGFNSAIPCDDDAHGTHTMGTIVGQTTARYTIGMAPEAQWMACRNMDEGEGRVSTYIECFQFFLAPYPVGGDPIKDGKPNLAPHITNNSWGCPLSEECKGSEFIEPLLALKKAGIMTVVSAGNAGPECSTINDGPAHHSYLTLSVGAINHRTERIATFSSRGPSLFDEAVGPDVVAPGVGIRSSLPGGGYSGPTWSGTSMAGPHVAGQVALLWSAYPNLVGKIDETVQMIRSSAVVKTDSQECGGVSGDHRPNNVYGWGYIDLLNIAVSSP